MTIDLGINVGGSGNNWIAYKPQADRWDYPEGEIDLKHFVLDHNSMKAGWGKLGPGIPPSWIWDKTLGLPEVNPGGTPEEKDEWSRGLSIELFVKGEKPFTWQTTAKGPMQGLNDIFADIWTIKDDNPGKLPVLEYTGSSKTTWNSRIPEFKILKWVDRPEEFTSSQVTNGEDTSSELITEAKQSEEEIPF